MLKKVLTIAAASALSTPAFAGFYVNVENNAAFLGKDYIGSGTDLINSLPSRGGVAIQANEIDDRNGGLTIFTSTDQAGNFRIGDGVVIDQQAGTVTGDSYTKSLFSTMTPFILALGGD
mgnify:CR=1 FL=1